MPKGPALRIPFAAILALLLCVLAAGAETSSAAAHVGLTVLDQPPHLASLMLLPRQPTPYDTMRCVGEIRDNSPETAVLVVNWSGQAGVLSSEAEFTPREHGMAAGEEVRCTAYARDSEGATSSALEVSAVLAEGGIADALEFYARGLTGIRQTYGTEPAAQAGMAAVTGFATGAPGSGGTGSLLIVAFVVLLSVNLLLLARRLRKR